VASLVCLAVFVSSTYSGLSMAAWVEYLSHTQQHCLIDQTCCPEVCGLLLVQRRPMTLLLPGDLTLLLHHTHTLPLCVRLDVPHKPSMCLMSCCSDACMCRGWLRTLARFTQLYIVSFSNNIGTQPPLIESQVSHRPILRPAINTSSRVTSAAIAIWAICHARHS
jgi:hypothetical protein